MSPSIIGLLAEHSFPQMLLAFTVGLPSLMLYCLETGIMLSKHRRRFRSVFFRLFLVRAIIHLASYVQSYVGVRFGRLGLFWSIYERYFTSEMISISWFLA